MQVFLPYSNFFFVAKTLDSKRLNKQIVEAYQILVGKCGHKNHPCVLAWEKSKGTLKEYLLELAKEYTLRFDKVHSCESSIKDLLFEDEDVPYFVYDPLIILSHRVRLLSKDYGHYSKYFDVERNIGEYPEGYFWTIAKGKTSKEHSENWINFVKENGVFNEFNDRPTWNFG